MKHLRGINATYKQIHSAEFKQLSKFYTISQRDIDFIAKRIDNPITNVPDPKGISTHTVRIWISKFEGLHILMDGDEYFYVVDFLQTGIFIFKCDQLEGLLDCLKEIYSI